MIAEICGHHAAGQRVAQEDVGVAAQADDALLDARAAAVVEADDRRAVLHRHVHDLADLLGVGFGQGAAEDGEVLREDVDQPPVDRAVAGDDAVAERCFWFASPNVAGAMGDEHIEFVEGAGVEQQIEPLAGGELALFMLRVDALLAAAQQGFLLETAQFFNTFTIVHGWLLLAYSQLLCSLHQFQQDAMGAFGVQEDGAAFGGLARRAIEDASALRSEIRQRGIDVGRFQTDMM